MIRTHITRTHTFHPLTSAPPAYCHARTTIRSYEIHMLESLALAEQRKGGAATLSAMGAPPGNMVPDQSFSRCCVACSKKEVFNRQFQTCARCRVAVYCGEDCQRDHWKRRHRDECKALREKREADLAAGGDGAGGSGHAREPAVSGGGSSSSSAAAAASKSDPVSANLRVGQETLGQTGCYVYISGLVGPDAQAINGSYGELRPANPRGTRICAGVAFARGVCACECVCQRACVWRVRGGTCLCCLSASCECVCVVCGVVFAVTLALTPPPTPTPLLLLLCTCAQAS